MGVKFWTIWGSLKKISKSNYWDDFFKIGLQLVGPRGYFWDQISELIFFSEKNFKGFLWKIEAGFTPGLVLHVLYFPLKLSLIVTEEAISSRRRPPPPEPKSERSECLWSESEWVKWVKWSEWSEAHFWSWYENKIYLPIEPALFQRKCSSNILYFMF